MNTRRLLLFTPALLVGLAISLALARPTTTIQDELDPGSAEEDVVSAFIAEEAEPEDEIVTETPVGEVTFPHYMHAEALEIACTDCHHETSAKALYNPHPQYFKHVWSDCNTCHRDDLPNGLVAGKCSSCHPVSPRSTSDAALSAKVVIHRKCWDCHDVGTGQDAAKECSFCHSGPRTGFAPTNR